MEGGQSGTYLRLARALSGPRVSVAKTYRDENQTKMNISAQTQRPASAVEYKKLVFLYSTAEEDHCDLAEIFTFSFSLISICLSNAHPRAGQRSRQS